MGKLHPELNNCLAAKRGVLGFTQEQLARAASVSRQTIIAIEGGTYSPSTVLALRLSFLLDVQVNDLFQLNDSALTELQSHRASLYTLRKQENNMEQKRREATN